MQYKNHLITNITYSCRVLLDILNLRRMLNWFPESSLDEGKMLFSWPLLAFLLCTWVIWITHRLPTTRIHEDEHGPFHSTGSLEPGNDPFWHPVSCIFPTSSSSCSFQPDPFCNLWDCRQVTETVAAGMTGSRRPILKWAWKTIRTAQEGFYSFVFRQGRIFAPSTPCDLDRRLLWI